MKHKVLEWEKKKQDMENKFRPKKNILIVKDGKVVLDRLEEVASGCFRTVTDDEALFEWESEERKFWARWEQHLRQEKRSKLSGAKSDPHKVACQ